MSLKISEYGKQIIKTKREELGWNYNDSRWLKAASLLVDPNWPDELFFEEKYPHGISEGTLKRFEGGKKPIDIKIFKVYCQVLDLPWRDIAESCLIGRNNIVTKIVNMLQESHRLILLTGITGTGKTSLAEKVISELPDSYSEHLMFYFEDREQEQQFASFATKIISQLSQSILPLVVNQPENTMLWLVDYICNHQCVLLIDSLELALKGDQNTGWSHFKDGCWLKFFRTIMTASHCQGKIIITSQEMPIELEEIIINHEYLCYHELVRGFSDMEIRNFFQSEGIEFAENTEIANYLHRIGTAYQGHPLALKTIADEIINFPFHGDVNKYWCRYRNNIEVIEQTDQDIDLKSLNDKIKLHSYSKRLRETVKHKIEKTLQRLAKDVPNAYRLLCFGSIYRRPVAKRFWFRNLSIRYGLNREEQEIALDALMVRYLVEINNNGYLRQHNLIRSTALAHLRNIQYNKIQ